jgi:hypothetical protein
MSLQRRIGPIFRGSVGDTFNLAYARAASFRVSMAVSDAMKRTPRSSSMVENLNSRIRVCLTNRRHLEGGRAWLGLLQCVFSHRRFVRSRYAERTGRTPRELMSRQSRENWPTLLGLGSLQPLQA